MKCRIALGSNLGDRRAHLENAAQALAGYRPRVSPIFETPALVLDGAPEEWRKSFLNAVLEIEWPGSAPDLLALLKKIEAEAGRQEGPRWSPRPLDLDILTFGDQVLASATLQIPHAEIEKRAFVLQPLKHLAAGASLPGQKRNFLESARRLSPLPLWMWIFNLTPDSFSDGGQLSSEIFEARLQQAEEQHIGILDLGAESTRPGAFSLSADEEWRRLEPALEFLRERRRGRFFHSQVSLDSYHPETARRALPYGIDYINDVGGLADPAWLDVLRESSAKYIFMHNLGLPADPRRQLPEGDPVAPVREFAQTKLRRLEEAGIDLSRVIFDPGIGFGKSASQSRTLLQRIEEFFSLPVPILVGASRKSFLKLWTQQEAPARDPESLGISLKLAARGVDILRVHEAPLHARAWRTYQEI